MNTTLIEKLQALSSGNTLTITKNVGDGTIYTIQKYFGNKAHLVFADTMTAEHLSIYLNSRDMTLPIIFHINNRISDDNRKVISNFISSNPDGMYIKIVYQFEPDAV